MAASKWLQFLGKGVPDVARTHLLRNKAWKSPEFMPASTLTTHPVCSRLDTPLRAYKLALYSQSPKYWQKWCLVRHGLHSACAGCNRVHYAVILQPSFGMQSVSRYWQDDADFITACIAHVDTQPWFLLRDCSSLSSYISPHAVHSTWVTHYNSWVQFGIWSAHQKWMRIPLQTAHYFFTDGIQHV